MGKVYIGTSGFLYSHWIGDFYPTDLKRDDFLTFYAHHFNTVEINSSFYHIPKIKTVENWLKKAPKDFIFTFKMSRFVTHFGKLDPKTKSFNLFFESIRPLESQPAKHLVLIQTSSSFGINLKKLENFLSHLPKTFLYAFEFRNWSWFGEEIYQILKKHNAAVVLSDTPIRENPKSQIPNSKQIQNSNDQNSKQKSFGNWKLKIENFNRLWPYVNVETASFFYIRFHGSRRLFASSYTDKELKFYAKLIKEKLKKEINVYAYFNNDAEGAAIKDAKRLKEFLS